MDDIETIERKITGAWQVISPDNYNGEMQIYVSIIERHIIFKSSLHASSVIAFDRDMFTLATNNGEIHLTRQNTKDVFTILFFEGGKWMLWKFKDKPYLFLRAHDSAIFQQLKDHP